MDDYDHLGEPPGWTADARRDRAGPSEPLSYAEFEAAADAEWARLTAGLEAGRERIPEEWEVEGPAVSLSLGDACDLDPALLAAILGPDGLGGQALSPAFGQGAPVDAPTPGPGAGNPGRAGDRFDVGRLCPMMSRTGMPCRRPGGWGTGRRTCRRWWWRSSPAAAPPSSRTPGLARSPSAAAPASSPARSWRLA